MEASWWEGLAVGKTGSCSGAQGHAQLLFRRVQVFATSLTAARQASMSFIVSWSLLKLMSIESMMPSNHLILCHPLLLLPSIIPSIRAFFKESALHIRWPKYWSFSFSTGPSNEYSGLISFRIDLFDLLEILEWCPKSRVPQNISLMNE